MKLRNIEVILACTISNVKKKMDVILCMRVLLYIVKIVYYLTFTIIFLFKI